MFTPESKSQALEPDVTIKKISDALRNYNLSRPKTGDFLSH